MQLLIGADVGTTASKILIIDESGTILAQSYCEYPLIFPASKQAEQNIELIRDVFFRAIRDAISQLTEEQRRSVTSLALSTQRSTMTFLDRNGRPLRNAITWMDGRAGLECEEIRRDLGKETVIEATGMSIGTIWSFAFLCWLKRNERSIYDRTDCFALVNTYLLHELGAEEYVTDYSSASETLMFDPRRMEWSSLMLDYLGLEKSRLPRPVPSGVIVGTMKEELAREFGILHPVMLVSGGGDQQCAALGGGVLKEGDISIGMGTAANILALSSKFRFDSDCNLITNVAALPGHWFMEGSLIVCGPILNWMRDLLYAKEKESMTSRELYELMDLEVLKNSVPGSHGLSMVPHFQGAGCPYWDDDATGILEGMTLSTNRADLIRSVMEGMAMEVRKNLDLLLKNGIKAERMVLTGGASRSPVWCQIMADVQNVPVEIPQHPDVAALGAAVLAGWASGVYDSPEKGAEILAKAKHIYLPDPESSAFYKNWTKHNDALYFGVRSARNKNR